MGARIRGLAKVNKRNPRRVEWNQCVPGWHRPDYRTKTLPTEDQAVGQALGTPVEKCSAWGDADGRLKSAAPCRAGRVAATIMDSDGFASWTLVGLRCSDPTARSLRVYTDMQLSTEIRRRALAQKLSKRQACRDYGLHGHTLAKILAHSEPPGERDGPPDLSLFRLHEPRTTNHAARARILHHQ